MNERISEIINHPKRNQALISAGIVIGASAVAYGIGYLVGRRKAYFEVEFEPQLTLDFDMKEVREPQVIINEEELDISDPTSLPVGFAQGVKPPPVIIDHDVYVKGSEFVEEHIAGKDVEAVVVQETEVEVISQNVFAGNDDGWDYEEETKTRNTRMPYVLHKDEFYADEKDYTQVTLTYYAGDNILVDEDDSPIYNHEQVVGPLRFGHGSGDPNVFHVRNDKLRAEYEICRDPGLYSVEVLGLEIENNQRAQDLKHSNGPLKFRSD